MKDGRQVDEPHRAGPEVNSLTEIRLESVRGLDDVEEWEELWMTVDSGAGATVVSDRMVKAVSAVNPRPEIQYEVADGTHIPNMGEKYFAAATDCGSL